MNNRIRVNERRCADRHDWPHLLTTGKYHQSSHGDTTFHSKDRPGAVVVFDQHFKLLLRIGATAKTKTTRVGGRDHHTADLFRLTDSSLEALETRLRMKGSDPSYLSRWLLERGGAEETTAARK